MSFYEALTKPNSRNRKLLTVCCKIIAMFEKRKALIFYLLLASKDLGDLSVKLDETGSNSSPLLLLRLRTLLLFSPVSDYDFFLKKTLY